MTIIKFNKTGDQLWNESWGGSVDQCNSLVVDSQKNIYVAGETDSIAVEETDMLLMKYNHSRPDITIVKPTLNQRAGKRAPEYELSIVEPYRNVTWYTINGSSTIQEIFSDTGTIDQNEWSLLGNGTLTLQFYANNTAGVGSSEEVIIRRDIIDPELIIVKPSESQGFTTDPPFVQLIFSEKIDSCWFTIDDGEHNQTCSITPSYVAYADIDSEVWKNASYGNVTIQFWANDTVGNIGYNEINVTKVAQAAALLSDDGGGGGGGGGEKEAIPGYHIVIIAVVILSVTIIVFKKRYNKHLQFS